MIYLKFYLIILKYNIIFKATNLLTRLLELLLLHLLYIGNHYNIWVCNIKIYKFNNLDIFNFSSNLYTNLLS
jgi:hypothetical protein